MNDTDHTATAAAVLTIEGRAHTLTEPPHVMRLNITPEEDETGDGIPIAGEVFTSSRGHASKPGLNRFDTILLDGRGQLWEVAYFVPPREEQGFFVYAPTTPAEAAQFLTDSNPLLRAIFGTTPAGAAQRPQERAGRAEGTETPRRA